MQKKVLIVGKNSYIGNCIDNWLSAAGWKIDQLDVLVEDWKNYDYSGYDTIIHVAGIVHRPNCTDWGLYKAVNADMPIEIAKISKKMGVKQYVYFSTMGVYKETKKLNKNILDTNSLLAPNSMYGKSKLLAEEGLLKLQDSSFAVSIVRPPSVYGEGCKGGYIKGFVGIVRKMPILPYAYNHVCQSFIYIDNLTECIKIIISNNLKGIFCPQDDEIPSANRLMEAICIGLNKGYHSSKCMGFLIRFVSFMPIVKKAYGGIEYSRELSNIDGFNYVVVPFEEGMRRTVRHM